MAQKKRKPGSTLRQRLKLLWQTYTSWEIALFGLGALSLAGIIVILFMPVGKGPELIQPTAPLPPAGSPAFLASVSRFMALPVDTGPSIETLENGDEIIPALLKDIDGAKHSITFMAYIWKDGKLSDTMLDHLMQRQRAGVQVRILLDGYGSLKAPTGKLEKLKALGGRVATFHSLTPLPWTVMRSTKRNHRRAIVIDGRVGYTGGLGVDDVWLGNARDPSQWHDLMFRVRGTMAERLQGSFSELWAVATGEMLTGDDFYPAVSETGSIPYLALSSSPSPDLYETETLVLLSLAAARHDIEIETPYFLPNESVRNILINKARSGVSVSILVPNDHTDEKSVRWAGQRIYQELLEAGVKIYEYQPTFTHTKLLAEDGLLSVIGSANMDIRSRRLNDEVLLAVSDPVLAQKLEATFQQDLTRSKPIELEAWRHRGLVQRALEILCQAFVQQY